ncbi:MAG: 1-(5-phosphoribosyl)-5-((5-phosphoribosylamino)methylideneamino)imidazole-4-carboxamide isomerase, partial [Candidatus Omnitrophica bacterium]|nr:1-(5-phosphoribosyl)-5-((5-phosphoribosylamino)methylideneamino)imidazole-4-carboxamide isomerase [Candidatus Omnitrophota bacterium]
LHVIDLDGAKAGRPVNFEVAGRIAERTGIPVQTGGGFRTIGNIREALDAGVFRVIIGSRAFEDKDFIGECVRTFGEKVIFSVDVIGLKAGVRGWVETSDENVHEKLLPHLAENGVKEIIYTDIKSDGMLSGPNMDALRKIFEHVEMKIISAGGIKDIGHIRQLKELEVRPGAKYGVSGAIIGRAIYEGTIDLKEAINVGKENNTVS